MTERSALVVGESLIDVVRRPDGVTEHPGGSPAIVAIALARLGRPVQLATWAGHGPYGDVLRRWFRGCGVELVPGSDGAISTSIATAELDEAGDATYRFDFTFSLPSGAADAVGPATPVVHTGSLAAVDDRSHDDVLALLTDARSTATITYDPNIRPDLMGDRDQTEARVAALARTADVVKVSVQDLAWLAPDEHPLDVARRWVADGALLVVVTEGPEGATAVGSGEPVHVAAVPVEVADTVGAGDAFMGALIDGLWEAELLGAGHRDALRRADEPTLRRVLERCTRVAALAVERQGASPPTQAALDSA